MIAFTLNELKNMSKSEFALIPRDVPIRILEFDVPFVLYSKNVNLSSISNVYPNLHTLWNPLNNKLDSNDLETVEYLTADTDTTAVIQFVCVNVNSGISQILNVFGSTGSDVGKTLPMSFITTPDANSPTNIVFPFDLIIRDVSCPTTIKNGKLQLWVNGVQTGNFWDLSTQQSTNSGRPLFDVPLVAGSQIQIVVATKLSTT